MLVPAPVPMEVMARTWLDILREDADALSLQVCWEQLLLGHAGVNMTGMPALDPKSRNILHIRPELPEKRAGGPTMLELLDLQRSLRSLAAAKRGYPDLRILKTDLSNGILMVLDRAMAVSPLSAPGEEMPQSLCLSSLRSVEAFKSCTLQLAVFSAPALADSTTFQDDTSLRLQPVLMGGHEN